MLYSGTVAAALEATLHHTLGLAVSYDGDFDGVDLDPVAVAVADAATRFLRIPGNKKTAINMNIPSSLLQEPYRYEVTRLGKRIYRDRLARVGSEEVRVEGESPLYERAEGTDFRAVADNRISITPLTTDLTDRDSIEAIGKYFH